MPTRVIALKKDWQKLQVRAMKQDFSWDKSAQKYIEIYKQVMPLVNISEDEKQEIAIAS